MAQLSRRDMLKLITLASASLAARPLASALKPQSDASNPHVIIFVFDAWSAAHMKMYGYPRLTMPNLERFAERCLVYHNHHSSGTFTVPGTASLLTGLQPWTHRAYQLTAGGVVPNHRSHNLFNLTSASRGGFGYAQNPYADIFLYQFAEKNTGHAPHYSFNINNSIVSSTPLFQKDYRIAYASFENNIFRNGKGTSGSLYLGLIARLAGLSRYASLRKENLAEYPFGLPNAGGFFFLDAVADGLINAMRTFESPTAAYFHVFPPHEPYAPRREFIELFNDGWLPVEKPIHPLSRARRPFDELVFNRLRYDQYLAAWDAEFARVIEYMESSGMLEKSIVIITADHGELFERGEMGHNTLVLASPIAHVPLLISLPGMKKRIDVDAFTSSLDVLPTIAHLTGLPAPAWGEGLLLPELGGSADPNRSVYAIDAKTTSSFSAIERYSIAMIKQGFRLVEYKYPEFSAYEFYDVINDPQELQDLYPRNPSLAVKMKKELLETIEDFNRPYRK
ncbi:MAG: Choline-sulfatase [Anaerolineales bacterium]|nr:Choline-sulfatase [Anaerolineales bacterium]